MCNPYHATYTHNYKCKYKFTFNQAKAQWDMWDANPTECPHMEDTSFGDGLRRFVVQVCKKVDIRTTISHEKGLTLTGKQIKNPDGDAITDMISQLKAGHNKLGGNMGGDLDIMADARSMLAAGG